LTRETIESLLIFQNLESDDLDLLVGLFEAEQYIAGQKIFQQGQRADKVHILVEGTIEIQFKPYDGEVITVTSIHAGDIFGWSAVLGRWDYTSDAVASEDGHGLSMQGKVLREFCAEHPSTGIILLERLAEVISARLRSTHEKVVDLLQKGVADPLS
jgi:CRP-like cAMP-binding protein